MLWNFISNDSGVSISARTVCQVFYEIHCVLSLRARIANPRDRAQIDFRMGVSLLPVNEALKIGIEEVLHYYAYRPLPGGLGNIA